MFTTSHSGGASPRPTPTRIDSAASSPSRMDNKAQAGEPAKAVTIHVSRGVTPGVSAAISELLRQGIGVTLRPGRERARAEGPTDVELGQVQPLAHARAGVVPGEPGVAIPVAQVVREPGADIPMAQVVVAPGAPIPMGPAVVEPDAPVPMAQVVGDRPRPRTDPLATSLLVARVGARHALVQGAGQLLAGAIHAGFFSMLAYKASDSSVTIGVPAMSGLAGVLGATWEASGGSRGQLGSTPTQSLQRAIPGLLLNLAPLAARLLPTPYAQIGLVLAVSQMGRTYGVLVAEGLTHLLRGTGTRAQLVLPDDAAAADRVRGLTLSTTVDRDRQAIMMAVYLLAGVVGALVFAQRATGFDTLVDRRLSIDTSVWWEPPTSEKAMAELTMPFEGVLAGVTAFLAFAETVAGAVAARRHGLRLVERAAGWCEPMGRNLCGQDGYFAHFVPAKAAQRLKAEWAGVDWLAALVRTGLEMAGITSSTVAQKDSSVVTNVAQYFTRLHGVSAQGQDMHHAHLRDLGHAQDPMILMPPERTVGEFLDNYDLFLGSNGMGLDFQKAAQRDGEVG
ncbi:MAG: hypothetical protein V4609_07110 [Pseudomonadota bacterium]